MLWHPSAFIPGLFFIAVALSSCDVKDKGGKNLPKPLAEQEIVNNTNFLATKLSEHKQQIQGLRNQIDNVKQQISESTGMPEARKQALRNLLIAQSRQVESLREQKEQTEVEIERLQEQASR